MKKRFSVSSIFLLLAAIIWGIAFVAQSVGNDYMGPFAYNGIRLMIGTLTILPLFIKAYKNDPSTLKDPAKRKSLLIAGLVCGIVMCAATNLQQASLSEVEVGKAGFITALYIVLVPILGLIFLRKRTAKFVWIAVALALVGLYLMCVDGEFAFSSGEICLLLCAFFFAVHIMLIDHFTRSIDPVQMSFIQFGVAGVISLILMCIFGQVPTGADIQGALIPILYSGILSCGVGYTFQALGQKNTEPTMASLLLSLQSCFSVLAGWIALHQVLTPKELIGCAIMFAAVILAQIR